MHLTIPVPDPRQVSPERTIPDPLVEVVSRALEGSSREPLPGRRGVRRSPALRPGPGGERAPLEQRVGVTPGGVITCATCGLIVAPTKFCGECGARLPVRTGAPRPAAVSVGFPLALAAREEDIAWLDATPARGAPRAGLGAARRRARLGQDAPARRVHRADARARRLGRAGRARPLLRGRPALRAPQGHPRSVGPRRKRTSSPRESTALRRSPARASQDVFSDVPNNADKTGPLDRRLQRARSAALGSDEKPRPAPRRAWCSPSTSCNASTLRAGAPSRISSASLGLSGARARRSPPGFDAGWSAEGAARVLGGLPPATVSRLLKLTPQADRIRLDDAGPRGHLPMYIEQVLALLGGGRERSAAPARRSRSPCASTRSGRTRAAPFRRSRCSATARRARSSPSSCPTWRAWRTRSPSSSAPAWWSAGKNELSHLAPAAARDRARRHPGGGSPRAPPQGARRRREAAGAPSRLARSTPTTRATRSRRCSCSSRSPIAPRRAATTPARCSALAPRARDRAPGDLARRARRSAARRPHLQPQARRAHWSRAGSLRGRGGRLAGEALDLAGPSGTERARVLSALAQVAHGRQRGKEAIVYHRPGDRGRSSVGRAPSSRRRSLDTRTASVGARRHLELRCLERRRVPARARRGERVARRRGVEPFGADQPGREPVPPWLARRVERRQPECSYLFGDRDWRAGDAAQLVSNRRGVFGGEGERISSVARARRVLASSANTQQAPRSETRTRTALCAHLRRASAWIGPRPQAPNVITTSLAFPSRRQRALSRGAAASIQRHWRLRTSYDKPLRNGCLELQHRRPPPSTRRRCTVDGRTGHSG